MKKRTRRHDDDKQPQPQPQPEGDTETRCGPGPWWAFGNALLHEPPAWMAGAKERLRLHAVDNTMNQLALALGGGGVHTPSGNFCHNSGLPYLFVKVSHHTKVAVIPTPALWTPPHPVLTGTGTGTCCCGCKQWWASRTGTMQQVCSLLSDMIASLMGPKGTFVLVLPHARCTQDFFALATRHILEAHPHLSPENIVFCVTNGSAPVPPTATSPSECGFVTDCPPVLVAAALRQTGGLIVGFNSQHEAILCDSLHWDGAGLDHRMRECLAALMGAQASRGAGFMCSPWSWVYHYAQRQQRHLTPGCCPAFLARCFSFVRGLEQQPSSPAARQQQQQQQMHCDENEVNEPRRFPCLCGGASILVCDEPSNANVTSHAVELIDYAAIGADCPEVLVLLKPSDAATGVDHKLECWLGPCKTGIVFIRTEAADLAATAAAETSLPRLGQWKCQPCPDCLEKGLGIRRPDFAFVDEMEEALDQSPYQAGQSMQSRLPYNFKINNWLRFGCATAVFSPFELQLRPGSPPALVRLVLVDSTKSVERRQAQPRPLRFVLVDASHHVSSQALQALIASHLHGVLGSADNDNVTLGILFHGSTLQEGLKENSNLRFV